MLSDERGSNDDIIVDKPLPFEKCDRSDTMARNVARDVELCDLSDTGA